MIKFNCNTCFCFIITCFIFLFLLSLKLNAQKNKSRLPRIVLKEIKVGEQMSDIPLGTVVNNYTGKKRFSDFKGKLVILDFWNSNCSSCIANFPHMSDLQKKFGEKIQIFLVNHEETQAEIQSYFSNHPKYKNIKNLIPDNLPSIVSNTHGDNILNKLFPSKGETGYHVWINGSGTVILRGPSLNTYPEKILDVLEGREIDYISDEGVSDQYGSREGLYMKLAALKTSIIQYNSLITRFTDATTYYGAVTKNKVDAANGTVRNSFLNYSILNLYFEAVKTTSLKEEWGRRLDINLSNKLQLLVADSSQYYAEYRNQQGKEDRWLRENAFCYEQITPSQLSGDTRANYMLEDLNRYFKTLHGTNGRIEAIKTESYILIKTANLDKLRTKGVVFAKKDTVSNGKPVTIYNTIDLRVNLMGHIKSSNPTLFEALNKYPFIDESGLSGTIDIILPRKMETLEELRQALKKYNLDIVKEVREVRMLIINENK